MFSKCKKLLAEWLDHSQRNSGYMCDENYSKAIAELKAVEALVEESKKPMNEIFRCGRFWVDCDSMVRICSNSDVCKDQINKG